MLSFRRLSDKLVTPTMKWVWIGLSAVPAIRIYYVREMVAALMIFSILFLAGAGVVLILFVLDFASERLIAWVEGGVLRAAGWAVEALRGPLTKPALVDRSNSSQRRVQASASSPRAYVTDLDRLNEHHDL